MTPPDDTTAPDRLALDAWPEGAPRPNLFLVGAPKCGTTALASWLAEREDVHFCEPKEPFLLADDIPNARALTLTPDIAAYAALFAGADPARHRVIGEGSTNYLRSRRAVDNALALSPDARFVAMLRDPVAIAHAYHMEQRFARNEDEPDFGRAWALQEARAEGRSIPEACHTPDLLQYRWIASIGSQLERLFARVPEDRRLVLFQEDLKDDPAAVWRRVLAFLGLPDDGRTAFPAVNAAHGHRFETVADLWLDPPVALRGPVRVLRTAVRRARVPAIDRIKAAMRKPRARDPIPPELDARLRAEFEPEVRKVEALTGRELPAWRGAA